MFCIWTASSRQPKSCQRSSLHPKPLSYFCSLLLHVQACHTHAAWIDKIINGPRYQVHTPLGPHMWCLSGMHIQSQDKLPEALPLPLALVVSHVSLCPTGRFSRGSLSWASATPLMKVGSHFLTFP